jgi:hypothetical protein
VIESMDKFDPNYLTGIQEQVYKVWGRMPGRCRLFGMDRDLNEGEIRALAYFEASVNILNHMGALKDGALNFVVPTIIQKTQESVWSDE